MTDQKNVIVYRTGKVYEFDMVRNELTAASIPVFSQEQTSAGLRLATPATLSGGPGTWWNISVPDEYEEQAHQIISALPCGEKLDPEVWDFATPTAKHYLRSFLRWYYGIPAAAGILYALWYAARWLVDWLT